MAIAILSDTHIPGQADELPDPFRDRLQDADHVVQAGDFGSHEAFVEIADLAADLTAVYGNTDPDDVDLPAVASVEIGGVTFVVTHGDVNRLDRAAFSTEGVVTAREDWLDAVASLTRYRAMAPMVGIGGHSHDVEDTVHEGVRLLNPGSATDVGRAQGATMMTAEVRDGEVDVTVHEV